jgi:mannose-6-phosphate isomerase-like protein (cupin superfamily)
MTYFIRLADAQPIVRPNTTSYRMLGPQHGCVHGFSCGVSVYYSTDYVLDRGHADQEGFVILEGTGWAIVGDEEQHVVAGDCFIAPAGVDHQLKRDANVPHVKACWFHGAIAPAGAGAPAPAKPASYFIKLADAPTTTAPYAVSRRMLNTAQGCVYGFSSGMADYLSTEYHIAPQGHADQEGFVVLEGTGWAKVGDEEQHIGPGDCFIAPAGAPHGIRRNPGAPHVRVAWFHGAIA